MDGITLLRSRDALNGYFSVTSGKILKIYFKNFVRACKLIVLKAISLKVTKDIFGKIVQEEEILGLFDKIDEETLYNFC